MSTCNSFKTANKLVCHDYAGGSGPHGKGRTCIRFVPQNVRVCADFGKKGHGKLSAATRERIKESVHEGKFGGTGTFHSISACEAQVRKQLGEGVPYATVSKRVNLIRTFNKCKSSPNKKICRVANPCEEYLRSWKR